MVFYAACFEPAAIDKAMKRDPGPIAMSPYGSFDTVMATLNAQLETGPYLLGADFLAADDEVRAGAGVTFNHRLCRSNLFAACLCAGPREGRRTGRAAATVLILERLLRG